MSSRSSGPDTPTTLGGCVRHGGYVRGCSDCARALSEAIAKIQPEGPSGPITGGFHGLTTCPHCGKEF